MIAKFRRYVNRDHMKFLFVLALAMALSVGGTPMKTAPVVTEAQMQRWLKNWQTRLALEDWTISVYVVRTHDLKPDTIGNLRWNSVNKTASIRVMDPLDYDLPATDIPADMEYTVVHELVHLQLAMLPKTPGSKETEERAVNRIAEALFSLEKGPRFHPRSGVTHASTKDRSASEASRSSK